ncbi:hypothetical protein TEQG_05495 [Trichophyton equinum CBS 127.97]|uniref:Uncharacterized protein n=1 Tax=Trichophyton equinum (strain ATCC MYA-4606 / CBS 127.97) TaxID=559882 RepID=F2PX77_TRIEC|nr:hypothetical protein TEQG_05495 [Trichophyton equinum CBS 127.97]
MGRKQLFDDMARLYVCMHAYMLACFPPLSAFNASQLPPIPYINTYNSLLVQKFNLKHRHSSQRAELVRGYDLVNQFPTTKGEMTEKEDRDKRVDERKEEGK